MYSNKTTLLLDMNSTFMFGEDNFGPSEKFSEYYHDIGGKLSVNTINEVIRYVYHYLDIRYPDVKFRECFPSLETVITENPEYDFSTQEIKKIIRTFAYHEMGAISTEYVDVLHKLNSRFTLSVVIDIWAPKKTWLNLFNDLNINQLFMASSFSSDHGMVKPSPSPFNMVIENLGVTKEHSLMIGDSIRRDLGGAEAAGIDCVLVGGAEHPNALACYNNLIESSYDVLNR